MRNPAWVRDEVILALDLYVRAGRKQRSETDEEVVRLSELLRSLPFHPAEVRDENFRNAAGISMVLGNFLGIDPEHPGRGLGRHNHLQQEIWDQFAHDPVRPREIARAIGACTAERRGSDALDLDEVGCFPEGNLLTTLHLRRERNRRLVEQKKRQAIRTGERLTCEVCGFDFEGFYGPIGRHAAECHHVVPLSELPFRRLATLDDLAIVCANCHRVLHAVRPALTPAALRARLETLRSNNFFQT